MNYLVSAAIILFYLWHIAECSVCVCVWLKKLFRIQGVTVHVIFLRNRKSQCFLSSSFYNKHQDKSSLYCEQQLWSCVFLVHMWKNVECAASNLYCMLVCVRESNVVSYLVEALQSSQHLANLFNNFASSYLYYFCSHSSVLKCFFL